MSSQDMLDQTADVITDFFVPDEDKIRLLKSILETNYGREVSFIEAEEVGIQLVTLYQCLARDRKIVSGGSDEQP